MAGFSAKRCGQMLAGRFRLYLRSTRTYVALAYVIVMAATATIAFRRHAATFGQVFNAFEPFVYFFSNVATVALPAGGIFIALCDVARLSPDSLYTLIRCRRSEWWVAELLFTMIVTVCFYIIMLLFSMLLVMSDSYLKDTWSVFSSASAYGHSNLSLIATAYSTPITAALFTLLFQTLHAFTLVQITMTANIVTNRGRGAALAVMVEIVCYCMSLFGMSWFRPFSIFDRSLLMMNGMNTAMTWQTIAFYALLFAIAIVIQKTALKRYCFVSSKSE